MPRNLKMGVSTGGGSPADTSKADTTTAARNSVVNLSGIGKLAFSGVNREDQFTDGLRRAGVWRGDDKRHYISDRMLRRAAERKAAKAARKGGAK